MDYHPTHLTTPSGHLATPPVLQPPFYGLYPPAMPTATAAAGVKQPKSSGAASSSIKRPSASATPTSTTSSSPKSSSSSFAAALRNLAKNASSVANELPSSMTSSSASTGLVVHHQEPPALLDVRRGFDRSSDSNAASLASTTITSIMNSAPRTAVSETTGFQPYRPEVNHSMASYAASAFAASYGYHPAFFPSPHLTASPYGLDAAESLYRAQLERYSALARSASFASPTNAAFSGFYSPQELMTRALPATSASFSALLSTPPSSAASFSQDPQLTAPEKIDTSSKKDRKRRRSTLTKEHQQQPVSSPKRPAWELNLTPPMTSMAASNVNVENSALLNIRPPPSLATPPLIAPQTPTEIRLPTQPLDISAVKNITSNLSTAPFVPPHEVCSTSATTSTTASLLRGIRGKGQQPSSAKKPPFVRPFEDDYKTGTSSNNESENDDEMARMKKKKDEGHNLININNNIIHPDKASHPTTTPTGVGHESHKILNNHLKAKKKHHAKPTSTTASLNCANTKKEEEEDLDDSNSIKEDAIPKEKLKYLRYFRLGTHRKRNDVEYLSKLERKKGSKCRDKSFWPISQPPSPTLPIPCPSTKLPPDTNAKLMFFTMLGLWKCGEDDKKEHDAAWSVILDDKLARKSSSITVSYFTKVRDSSACQQPRKKCNDVFLNPDTAASSYPTTAPVSPASEIAESVASSGSSCSSRPLPINLSTLLPVSKSSLLDVTPAEMPPAWYQSGTLNIPGLASVMNASLNHNNNSVKSGAIMVWPGIEAIIDSYKKYNQDVAEEMSSLREQQKRLQSEMAGKRGQIDNLSSNVSVLARVQKDLQTRHSDLRTKFNSILADIAEIKAL